MCALQQRSGNACPTDEYITEEWKFANPDGGKQIEVTRNTSIVYVPIQKGMTPPEPLPTGAVQYNDLKGWGWDIDNTRARPNTTEWLDLLANPPADFWSVMCNNFRKTDNDHTHCYNGQHKIDPSVLKGAVHVRYECNTTLWILTYAFRDRGLSPTIGDMFACFDETDQANSGATKNIKYGGNAVDGFCENGAVKCLAGPVTCDASGKCQVCCDDMW